MKQPARTLVVRRWINVSMAAAVAAWCSTACDRKPDSWKVPDMTALSPRLQPLFDKTRTICFGRFLVDVPASATIVFGPAQVEWPIGRYADRAAKMAQDIAHRRVQIEEERERASEIMQASDSMYGKVLEGSVPGHQIIFGSEKNRIYYRIQSYFPIGKDYYLQEAGTPDRETDSEKADGKGMERAIATLKTTARNLRPLAEDDVPTEPGLCIDGAFVPDPGRPIHERVTVGIRLKEFPDVHFSIDAHKNDRLVQDERDELLKRLDDARRDGERQGFGDWFAGITFFRRGPRKIGDWQGSEVLARKPAQKVEGMSHEFIFESVGFPNDPLHPLWEVQLDTGVKNNHNGQTPPSLTDEEAIALWDKLTSSIRVRPTVAKATSSQSNPRPVPLDEAVATGRPCPQSGWWQCAEEPLPVRGGRTQRFRRGERMPEVVLIGKPGLWQRIKREAPTYPRNTVWTLVAYDDADPDVAKRPQGD